MSTLTMNTVRQNLIARGLLKPGLSRPASHASGAESRAKAIQSRRFDMGTHIVNVTVKKSRRPAAH